MPVVSIKQNENAENLIRRFKRACEKSGLLTELKRRMRYTKPTRVRAQKKAAAVKRHYKKVLKSTPIPSRGVRGKAKTTRRSSSTRH